MMGSGNIESGEGSLRTFVAYTALVLVTVAVVFAALYGFSAHDMGGR